MGNENGLFVERIKNATLTLLKKNFVIQLKKELYHPTFKKLF